MPKAQKSQREMFQDLASQFRRASRKPNIYGYKPHEKQEAFHRSLAKIRAFLGGNRAGKTVAGATEGVYHALGRHPYKKVPEAPTQGRIVGSDFVNSVEKILRPEFARWMPLSEIKGGSWEHGYDKESRVLTLENGSTVEFLSTDQDLDKHAGASRSWIWFDEEMPYDYYVENKMRLIDQNGDMWMTLTPLEGMSGWLFDDIYSASMLPENEGVIECFTVEMLDNPHLALSEASAFLAGMTEDEIQARQKGEFVQVGGLIYKDFKPETNIIEPFIPSPDMLHFNGMDHGFNNPTAWLWGAVDKDGRMFIYDEHYETGKIVSYHAKVVNERNLQHCEQAQANIMPAYSVGDPSIRNIDPITGTSVLLEYMEFGIPIVLGNNDVAAGINRVSRYIKDHEGTTKLYVTRNCTQLIWEMSRYRWGTWAQKKVARDKNKKEEPHKRNDHACDALRYMVASRPEVDVGTEVPAYSPYGGSTAVHATNRVDEGLVKTGYNKYNQDSLEYE